MQLTPALASTILELCFLPVSPRGLLPSSGLQQPHVPWAMLPATQGHSPAYSWAGSRPMTSPSHVTNSTGTQPCLPVGWQQPSITRLYCQLHEKPTPVLSGITTTTQGRASQPAWLGATLNYQHSHGSWPHKRRSHAAHIGGTPTRGECGARPHTMSLT